MQEPDLKDNGTILFTVKRPPAIPVSQIAPSSAWLGSSILRRSVVVATCTLVMMCFAPPRITRLGNTTAYCHNEKRISVDKA